MKDLKRLSVKQAEAGDIVIVTGIEEIGIGVTIAQLDNPQVFQSSLLMNLH